MGKKTAMPDGPWEVTIDGMVYDVRSLDKKHPGGSIFKWYVGKDATIPFHEFHGRSERPYKWLKTLKSRPATTELSDLQKDYLAFRQELVDEGYFDPSLPHTLYRMAEILVMHIVGVKLMLMGWWLPAVILIGLGGGRAGWFMHEAGHYSATGIPWLDRHIQAIFYAAFDSMSASWWRSQHNRHHATPQKLQHDVDLDTLPFLAFNKAVLPGSANWWIKLQAFTFIPITTFLVTIGWQLYLHPRFCLRKGLYLELGYSLLRWAAIAYFFPPLVGWKYTLFCYVLATFVGGMYIFSSFSLSHTHKDVVDADDHKDWIRYACEHTTDITPHWFTNWYMGYLNFQIEHHLFPQCPQFRFPLMAPRVKQFCEDHGIEYDQRPFFATLWTTLRNLHTVGNEHDHTKSE